MNIEELMYGDIVKTRDGDVGMIMRTPIGERGSLIVFNELYDDLEYYKNNLLHKSEKAFDIITVVRPARKHYLVPKRWKEAIEAGLNEKDNTVMLIYSEPETKKMTLEELEAKLGYRVEIVNN